MPSLVDVGLQVRAPGDVALVPELEVRAAVGRNLMHLIAVEGDVIGRVVVGGKDPGRRHSKDVEEGYPRRWSLRMLQYP